MLQTKLLYKYTDTENMESQIFCSLYNFYFYCRMFISIITNICR
jgi:hypothetical protein